LVLTDQRAQSLAALIPSLETTDPSRLSKHVVLDESISFHTQQREQIEALKAERDELLAEVKELRANALQDNQPPAADTIPNPGDIQSLGDPPQNDINLPGQDWRQLSSGEMSVAQLAGPAMGHPDYVQTDFINSAPRQVHVPGQPQWEPAGMNMEDGSHIGVPMNVSPMIPQQGWQMDPNNAAMPSNARSLSQDGLSFQMQQMQAPVPLFYSNNYSG
jgi:hypothetical protein